MRDRIQRIVEVMFNLWFTPDTIERIQTSSLQQHSPQAQQERLIEKEIEESGRGVCKFCKEEIVKNESMPGGGWIWESEFMLGFCDKDSGRKHKPLVKYVPDEGVVNIEPDGDSDA